MVLFPVLSTPASSPSLRDAVMALVVQRLRLLHAKLGHLKFVAPPGGDAGTERVALEAMAKRLATRVCDDLCQALLADEPSPAGNTQAALRSLDIISAHAGEASVTSLVKGLVDAAVRDVTGVAGTLLQDAQLAEVPRMAATCELCPLSCTRVREASCSR